MNTPESILNESDCVECIFNAIDDCALNFIPPELFDQLTMEGHIPKCYK